MHPWLLAQQHQEALGGPTSLGELPDFRGPSRLLKDAYKRSKTVEPNPRIGNKKKRTAKLATQTIDAYASTLSTSLRDQLRAFRDVIRHLPPFQRHLSELTLASLEREGGKSLKEVENTFDQLRRAVVRAGKEAVADASRAESVQDANQLTESGLAHVEDAFVAQQEALLELIKTAQLLRRLPRPADDESILVLVGMPNVGKSSLISATSTGTPEINDYPFTTRRLKMGHVIGSVGRYQVMDTPGVLHRPADERNPMEGLTLAAVEHLPSAVVFVMDLSGTCGALSAPLLQLAVREQVRALYPDRPWIDVRSKADLPLAPEVADDSAVALPDDMLHVSVVDGSGIEELRTRMAQLAGGEEEISAAAGA